jgi:putative DNA primase/helicase
MSFRCLDVARAAGLHEGKRVGAEHYFGCCCHEDRRPSLAVNDTKDTWLCGPCGAGGTAWQLAAFVAGVDPADKPAVMTWLEEHGLQNGAGGAASSKARITATYDYTDEAGELLYQVVRMEPKRFLQRRPDGAGDWIWKLGDARRVLYRLPELVTAEHVFVVEGEKDVDALRALGFTATTVPGGAGKWRDEYAEHFTAEHHVVVLPDNDDAGRRHANQVAAALHERVASVRILELSDVPPKGDVSDWIATFDDPEEAGERLAMLVESAPEWKPGEPVETPAMGTDDLSHDALALEMGEEWTGARHVAAWGRWLFWDGTRWEQDETLTHLTRCRDFLRGIANEVEASAQHMNPKEQARAIAAGKQLRNAHTVAAVASLARSNEEQRATTGQWDGDHYLLGTPGGTVDLRTGELRDARPEQYVTKATAVTPAPPETLTPLWSAFLGRIMAGDEDLISYLQRFLGYCLTGSIEEHAFAFGHGTGANGKGVFTLTMQHVLGDYALTVPTEILMVSHNERHPTELARLRGVRLAIGSEIEVGRTWAEARVKSLTGGDAIAARLMRQDFFEFSPAFKLLLCGNHKPSLRGVDEAIRRRLHLIPFKVTIPAAERDTELPEKLRAEWPGILRWAIDGCIQWQERGLDPPATVVDATDSYLNAEDAVGRWLEERTQADPNIFTATKALFSDWKEWAEAAGEYVGSQKRLGDELLNRDFKPHRDWTAGHERGARGFLGIHLRSSEQ